MSSWSCCCCVGARSLEDPSPTASLIKSEGGLSREKPQGQNLWFNEQPRAHEFPTPPSVTQEATLLETRAKIASWKGTHVKFLDVNTGTGMREKLSTRSVFRIDPSCFSGENSLTLYARDAPLEGEGLSGEIIVKFNPSANLTTIFLGLTRWANAGNDISHHTRTVALETEAPFISSGDPDVANAFTISFAQQSQILHTPNSYQMALSASGIEFAHPQTVTNGQLVEIPL